MSVRPLHVIVLSRAVASLHGVGGLERHVHDLIRHLLKRDVSVTLITRPPARGLLDQAPFDERLNVRYVPYPTFPFAGRRGTTVVDRSSAYLLFGLRAGRLAARLVKRGQIQIVHGMGAASLGYAQARARDRYETVPYIFNPHGMEEFGSTGPGLDPIKHAAYAPLRAAVRACARAADRVVATDRALVPTVQAHLRVPGHVVAVVPNAVDLDEVDRATRGADAIHVRARLGLSADDVLLLAVGRLEENKGFRHLIDALAQLARHPSAHRLLGSRWRCVVVGEGPSRARLERRILEAGLRESVSLPGRVDAAELHAWYGAATLFVHPTLYEGSSIATLEAMAHRRALVATAAGGIPDKVRPGLNGWLVPPGDARALACALKEALGDRARLDAMGQHSRTIVEREFAWDAVADRTLALYDEVLSSSVAAR